MERRKFTPEFKRQVVEQAIAVGNHTLIARKYDLRPNVVSKWVAKEKASNLSSANTSRKKAIPVSQKDREQLVVDYREIDQENTQLKMLLGEKDLEIAILRDLIKKTNPHLRIK